MKEVKYGVFGEDDPHRIFIRNFLKQMSNEQIQFNPDQHFENDVKAPRSFKKVISELDKFAKIAFAKYYIQLFIIVFDNDRRLNFSREYQVEIQRKMETLVKDDFGKKYIICVPVECIEHWLWHIKDISRLEKDKIKPSAVEKKSSSESKEYIYQTSVSSKKREIIEAMTENFSVDELRSVSTSFSVFYQSVIDYIKQIGDFESSGRYGN